MTALEHQEDKTTTTEEMHDLNTTTKTPKLVKILLTLIQSSILLTSIQSSIPGETTAKKSRGG